MVSTRCERCREKQAVARHEGVGLCATCYELRRWDEPAPQASSDPVSRAPITRDR